MDTDFAPGDPANIVLGRPDEKPARRHAPQKPKPIKGEKGILVDIRHRMSILEPLVKEHKKLTEANKVLKGI